MVDLLAKALLDITESLSHVVTNSADAQDQPTLEDLRALITTADAEFPGEMKALVEGVFKETLGRVKGALPLVDISEAMNKSVGVLSLSETPHHPLMWSHYTNNHTGFVIEFDPDHEFFFAEGAAAEMGGLHQVQYAAQRPKFDVLFDMSMVDASPEQIKEWVDKVFFTKSKDWEYEGEWRVLKPLKDATTVHTTDAVDIHLFKLPSACIKSVILGQRMSATLKQEMVLSLRADTRYADLLISEAYSSDEDFKIEVGPYPIAR
jgi:hypothetical protein